MFVIAGLFLRNSVMRVDQETGSVVVEVQLGRRLMGNLMTIYMPTILLNIIGHSTNYIQTSYFEAIVTVNLTAMLVLTTLFINVSNSLPPTSYLKMIDVYLIFSLLIPFVEVLLHTLMDSMRL